MVSAARIFLGHSRVPEALYALAGGREGVAAAISWLKARASWKETSVHEVTAAEGFGHREELKIVFLEPDTTRVNALAAADREQPSGRTETREV